MKRIILRISSFLFMMTILMVQFNVKSVSAEEEETVVSYYQAIVGSSNNATELSGFTAVSQFYYKNAGQIGQKDDEGETKSAISAKGAGSYYNLDSDVCNKVFKSGSADTYCNDKNNIKPAIAKLTITNHGDVEVYVGTNVSVANLQFYYVIANQSNQAQLFCSSSGTICDGAKQIKADENNMGAWKSYNRSGGDMVYNDSNIDGVFNKRIHATGGVTYDKFNIVTNMKPEYAELAKKYGVYVVTTLAVRYVYSNTEYMYYLNYGIQNTTFADVDNLSSNSLSNVNVCSKDNVRVENGCTAYPNSVSKAALLVKPSPDVVATNRGYNQISDYMNSTIIPITKIVVIMLFLVVGTTTVVTIVKSSDEPEVRHASIKKFITLFVSAVVVYLVLEFYPEIEVAVRGWFG